MAIVLGVLALAFSAGFMTSAVMANDLKKKADSEGCSIVDVL